MVSPESMVDHAGIGCDSEAQFFLNNTVLPSDKNNVCVTKMHNYW